MDNTLVTCLLFFSLLTGAVSAQDPKLKIAYNVLEDSAKDNYDIYIMNMDGTGQKNITNTPGVEWTYHTYKDRIFFISDRDTCHRCFFLYEMDARGDNLRKLSDLQLEDSWMSSRKDGGEMLVLGRIGKQVRAQLFLLDLKNGTHVQLTNDTISTKRDPMFLPGGREFVLAFRPDKTQRRVVPDELWKMNLDGTNRIQLTHFPKWDTITRWYEYHAGPPQWNNKEAFISYISSRNGVHQIFAVTPDGKKSWQITNDKEGCGWHSWSPDGEWLVMDKATGRNYDIFLMNYKTGNISQLTSGRKFEQAPVFVEIR